MSQVGTREVLVLDGAASLARAAAEIFVESATAATRDAGRFVVALAGGATPNGLYDLLASDAFASRIDWRRLEVFWGDERCVPPEDPESNYRSARERLLERVPIDGARVHRIRGEGDPPEAAAAYEHELRTAFATPSGPPRTTPGTRFDLVLLGMGADGHTASLFPETAAVRETERWVIAHRVPAHPSWRITLTPTVLNTAAEALFLVTGREKASALQRVLEGPRRPDLLPAQAIAPRSGRVRFLVDTGAASDLGPSSRASPR